MLLTIGAELALGWLGDVQMSESRTALSAMRQDNTGLREDSAALRKDNAALPEALNGMCEELSQIREDFDDLCNRAGTEEDVGQEEEVAIAQDDTIRSTLLISDAYRSGDCSALTDKQKGASEVLDQSITENMDDFAKEEAVYPAPVMCQASDAVIAAFQQGHFRPIRKTRSRRSRGRQERAA